MIRKLILTSFIITLLPGAGKRLSFDDVQGKSPFKYAQLGMMNWYSNKNAYLTWGKNENKGAIVEVSFPDRDTVTFVDSSAFYIDGNKLKVSRFTLDKTETKLLLLSNREQIWRHSYYGTYHIMDLKTKTIEPVSKDNTNLRNVKMSPDGKKVAYVRNDNNIYVYDLIRNREKKITNNGSKIILNGHFGWVYEEEFGSFDAYRWSPESQYIASVSYTHLTLPTKRIV